MTYQRNETPEPLASDFAADDAVIAMAEECGFEWTQIGWDKKPMRFMCYPHQIIALAKRLRATPAPGAPAGFKLVPVEPTDAMLDEGAHHIYEPTNRNDLERVWSVMLDAAPGAPGQEAAAVQAVGAWQDIATAPKDGAEFLAIWGHQGNVMQVVKWNALHKFWQTKGEPIAGFTANATGWMPLPLPPSGAGEKTS